MLEIGKRDGPNDAEAISAFHFPWPTDAVNQLRIKNGVLIFDGELRSVWIP